MKERTSAFMEYLKHPLTIWKILAFVFILWMTRSQLNYRIDYNRDKLDKYDSMHIDVAIMQIQTDLARIRKALEKK